jgi:hypothetical protein
MCRRRRRYKVGIGGAGSNRMFDGSRLVPSEARTDGSGCEAALERSVDYTEVIQWRRTRRGLDCAHVHVRNHRAWLCRREQFGY